MWLFSGFGFTHLRKGWAEMYPKSQQRVGNPKRKRVRWYFFLLPWLEKTAAAWGKDLRKGDVIHRRWVRWIFRHGGSCGVTAASVCLQLWRNRLEAREPVWWKETHIPYGRRTREAGRVEVNEPGETSRRPRPEACELVSPLMSDWSVSQPWSIPFFVYPLRESKTTTLFFFWGSQRLGAAPQKLVRSWSPGCD